MSGQQSELYKYTTQIDYLADLVGADVARDIVKVVVEQVDGEVDISDRANRDLGKVDVAQADSNLPTILETDNAGIAKENTLSSTLSREVATWSAGTLPVEQQSAVKLEDTTGAGFDPAVATEHPQVEQSQDLVGTGDITVGPVPVARSESVVISANSSDNNNWSASVRWLNSDGSTVYQTESSVDIALDSVDNDWSRLVRKGPYVEVTFTDVSGAAANNLNAYVDTQR